MTAGKAWTCARCESIDFRELNPMLDRFGDAAFDAPEGWMVFAVIPEQRHTSQGIQHLCPACVEPFKGLLDTGDRAVRNYFP